MQTVSLQMNRALHTTLLVLLLSVAGMGKAYAQEVTIGELKYRFFNSAARVTGHVNGEYAMGPIVIPSSVSYDGNVYSVTTIGMVAFSGCTGITSVTMGASITTIEMGAFMSCRGLTSLTIPNSITSIGSVAFSDCTGLTSVTIGNSVTEIGAGAFKNCSGLTSIIIPSSVTSIGDDSFTTINPFYGCTSLTNIIVEAGNINYSSIDGVLFNSSKDEIMMCPPGKTGAYVIPNSVTAISHQAFEGCAGLTSVTIPNSVISINNQSFSECTGLTSITIPNSVTSIDAMAFYGCSSLTNILVAAGNTSFASLDGVLCNSSKDKLIMCPPGKSSYVIPNSVTTIGGTTFFMCTGLTSVTIPNSVTAIEGSAFMGCKGLTSVTIPNSVILIGGGAFMGCSGLSTVVIPNSVTTIENGGDLGGCFAGCSNLTSVTIGNSAISIAKGMFANCTSLTTVNFGDSVSTIDGWAFSGCTSLASITIPNSVTSLGNSAFENCTSLASISIGNAVISIGSEAFVGCTSLSEINFNVQNGPLTIGREAFSGCTNLTSIIIPDFVTNIGKSAFMNCTSLASATIGNSVTSIGNEAFVGCTGLREVNFDAQNCSLNAASVWQDCHDIMLNIGDNVTGLMGCPAWSVISIDDAVETVNPNVFSGCDNLTTIIIGKSVKSIGSMAFANNPRLNMVYYNVEKDLESATNVFDNCPNLTTIHIGPDVQEIGSKIFKGCNTVHFVVALGPTPALLDAGAFSDIVDNSMLMVSCGKRVTYYSVWNMFPFNNIIEDCNEYLISIGVVGTGGNITSSVTNAQMGQTIIITITPNPGMTISSISVVNANDPTQIIPITPMGKLAYNYSFVMPPFEVVVMATFTTTNTSIEENATASISTSVYPNPTTGFVKVEAEGIRHITISNMLGQIIYEGKATGDEFEYDFGKHGKGLYLIRIETTSGVSVKKVLVR